MNMPEVAGITTVREELHALLDHIPDADVLTARKILRSLVDPVALALVNAPPDDEPLSAHEKAAVEAGQLREQRGEPLIPHEEILREFGLTEPDH
jgi:hypothetical protein